eukprot:TRINITY_DN1789_c0_g1_i1.p1 TRINITY_DN1789_c0_g1~~TRINITY_DN1789_c0_g1_i1.p1  ORF type:complete len:478 (+),score=29.02 TRINITY_DN1789_c0_g1_i1:174-1436(+)
MLQNGEISCFQAEVHYQIKVSFHMQGNIGINLMECDYSKDVEFLVGESEEPLKAHKCILSECSEVFKKMFYELEMKEASSSHTKIMLPEFKRPVMEEFLKYCYKRVVPKLSIEDSFSVLSIAEKYMVKELKAGIEKDIIGSIEAKNCSIILAYACPFSYCKEIEECAYEHLIGTTAIEEPKILNVLNKELVIKVIKNIMNGINPNVTVKRVLEYMQANNIKEDKDLESLLSEIVMSYSLTDLLSENAKALMEMNIIKQESLLMDLLSKNDKTVDPKPVSPALSYGVILHIYEDELGQLKIDPPRLSKSDYYNHYVYQMPTVCNLKLKNKDKPVRYWSISLDNPKLHYFYHEKLLKEMFCLTHQKFHSRLKIGNITKLTEKHTNGSLIIEETYKDKLAFEYLMSNRQECKKNQQKEYPYFS